MRLRLRPMKGSCEQDNENFYSPWLNSTTAEAGDM